MVISLNLSDETALRLEIAMLVQSSVLNKQSDRYNHLRHSTVIGRGLYHIITINLARSCENVSYVICEQQRCRSACADEHLCVRCVDSMICILTISKVLRF